MRVMKVTLEGHAWEIAAFLGRQPAPKSFGEDPTVLPPPLVPPPPSQPGPGRYLNGTRFETIQELRGGNNTTQIPIRSKQVIDHRLHFAMLVELNGEVRDGVWSIGISEGKFVLTHERTSNNDTQLATGDTINSFFIIDDYTLISYIDSGTEAISKTNNSESYTATAIYESVINPDVPFDARRREKMLMGVYVAYEPLPANGQVVLKYRVDGGSWVTVFTETTDGVLVTESNSAADGDTFEQGYEFEYRIESTGGAEITEFGANYELLESTV